MKCTNCGKRVLGHAKFCPNCGSKILKNKNIVESKKLSSKMWIAILFIFSFLIILVLLWFTGYIPICGDSYCVSKECISGCGDCFPDACQNGICQPQVKENCDVSPDCSCDVNEICKPNRTNCKENGCYEIVCGDGFCDSKTERSDNCCKDCSCTTGYTCDREKNECLFEAPEIIITDYGVLTDVSASTLYSNRLLIDDAGESHDFFKLVIENSGINTAKKVNLAVSLGNYAKDSESLGDLRSSESRVFEWTPTVDESILNIKDDQNVIVSVKIDYQDEHGKAYSTQKTYPVEIVGRNTVSYLTSDAQFVTPLDSVVRQAVSAAGSFSTGSDEGVHEAAEAVWDLLGGLNIEYISDPTREYRQYPAEVLNTKKGDCDDLATLYVSLLEAVGIKTALVTIPGHMFAAYYDSKSAHPVETTLIGSSFAQAVNKGFQTVNNYPNFDALAIEDEWSKKDLKVPGSVGVDFVDLSFPDIQVSVDPGSDWKVIDEGLFGLGAVYELNVYCDVTFYNAGSASGQKCVQVIAFIDGDAIKQDTICQVVDAGDSETERMMYSKQTRVSYSFKYRCALN